MFSIAKYRARLSPSLRGATFYLGYWGIVGVYAPFINIAFLRLGLNGREIGILATLLPIMTLLVAPPLAMLADRRAWRVRVLTGAIIGLALALTLVGRGTSFWTLLPLMILLAIARSPIGSLGDSLIARMAVQHQLNFGKMRLWGSLSFAVIAAVSGFIWERLGFGTMFLVAGLLFLPVSLSAALLEERPQTQRSTQRSFRTLGADGELLALLVASFLVGAAIGMDLIFASVFMDQLGGTEGMVGLLMGISAFTELPAMLYGAAIARRWGGRRALLLAYGTLGCSFVGFAIAWAPIVLFATGALRGLGFGLYFIATVQAIDERVPEEWSASAQAVMNAAAWGLAPLLAGPLSGLLFDAYGPRAIYIACTASVSIGALALFSGPWLGAFAKQRAALENKS